MMKVVARSSCESEYVGLSETGNKAMYLTQLQGEMWIGEKGVLLHGDNVLLESGNEPSVPLAFQAHSHQVAFPSGSSGLGTY